MLHFKLPGTLMLSCFPLVCELYLHTEALCIKTVAIDLPKQLLKDLCVIFLGHPEV